MARLSNPRKKRLFLHVGLHKTGTTSIQWTLTSSRQKLAEAGIVYPQAGAPEWANLGQHLLAWSVVSRPNYLPTFNGNRAAFSPEASEKLWGELYSETDRSSAPTVILSSEEFDILTNSEITTLGQRLDRYDVTPILFLRNHADFLESAYRTSVIHSAYREDISAFSANQRTRLDYAELIEGWRNIATGRIVKVVDYDRDDVRRDSVGAFLQLIGPSGQSLPRQSRRDLNESVPAFICEIVRFMRLKGCEEAHLAKWIADMRHIGFSGDSVSRYRLMPSDLRAQLLERYANELRSINAELGVGTYMQEPLTYVVDESPRMEIRNVVEALLALGHETAIRPPE